MARPKIYDGCLTPARKEMSYSTVAFPDSVNDRPFQPKRRNTKYTEIAAVMVTDEAQQTQVPVPIPRSRSLDRKDNPSLANNPPSDVPPVPIRVESQEDKPRERRQASPKVEDPFQAHPKDPHKADPFDPFADDPFAGDADEWRDSTAFYDRPPPLPSVHCWNQRAQVV